MLQDVDRKQRSQNLYTFSVSPTMPRLLAVSQHEEVVLSNRKMLKSIRLVAITSLICVLATSCGRDTSTPSKVLVGHWVAVQRDGGEKVDYCYGSDGKVVSREQSTDTIKNLPYTVISESPAGDWVEIATGEQASVGFGLRVVFASDNKSAKVFPGGSFGENFNKLVKTTQEVQNEVGQEVMDTPDLMMEEWKYVSSDSNSCR